MPVLLEIDPDDPRPIYQKVADEIRSLIAGATLKPGDQLPSVRQIAGDLGVNLNTVATAYRQLEGEGLITVRHGARAVVAARRPAAAPARDLRRGLRNSLTQLVLAGWQRSAILTLVADELRELHKGGR